MKENTASSTAYTVLQGLIYIAKCTEHRYLVPDEMYRLGEQVLLASDEGRKRLAELDKPAIGIKTAIREFIFLPGITLHYILRKRCIEEKTREAIAGGVTQVISLGAGFDSLAYRLSCEFPDVNFIEIDHPDTQKFKENAFDQADTVSTDQTNLSYLSVDFTHQNIESRLQGFAAFDSSRPTLFISEGVTMYLTEDEITHMFQSMRNLAGVGTKFLFTALEPRESPRNNTRLALFLYLKLIGEPIKWSMEAPRLGAFLEKQGCVLHSVDATDEFKSRYLRSGHQPRLHHGEYVAMAEFQ